MSQNPIHLVLEPLSQQSFYGIVVRGARRLVGGLQVVLDDLEAEKSHVIVPGMRK